MRATGFGLTDDEVMERMWSYLRGFASITKEMSPSRRVDALTYCLLHYGRQSKSKLGERLKRKMLRAIELRKSADETLTEMMNSIPGKILLQIYDVQYFNNIMQYCISRCLDCNECQIEQWLVEEKEYYAHGTVKRNGGMYYLILNKFSVCLFE